jgi:hypothetical protein
MLILMSIMLPAMLMVMVSGTMMKVFSGKPGKAASAKAAPAKTAPTRAKWDERTEQPYAGLPAQAILRGSMAHMRRDSGIELVLSGDYKRVAAALKSVREEPLASRLEVITQECERHRERLESVSQDLGDMAW